MPAQSLGITGIFTAVAAGVAGLIAFIGKRKLKRLDDLERTVEEHGEILQKYASRFDKHSCRLDETADTLLSVQRISVAHLVVTTKFISEMVRVFDRLEARHPDFGINTKGLEKVIDLAYEDLRQLGVQLDK